MFLLVSHRTLSLVTGTGDFSRPLTAPRRSPPSQYSLVDGRSDFTWLLPRRVCPRTVLGNFFSSVESACFFDRTSTAHTILLVAGCLVPFPQIIIIGLSSLFRWDCSPPAIFRSVIYSQNGTPDYTASLQAILPYPHVFMSSSSGLATKTRTRFCHVLRLRGFGPDLYRCGNDSDTAITTSTHAAGVNARI